MRDFQRKRNPLANGNFKKFNDTKRWFFFSLWNFWLKLLSERQWRCFSFGFASFSKAIQIYSARWRRRGKNKIKLNGLQIDYLYKVRNAGNFFKHFGFNSDIFREFQIFWDLSIKKMLSTLNWQGHRKLNSCLLTSEIGYFLGKSSLKRPIVF